MAKARSGLGKGLNALIPEKKPNIDKVQSIHKDIHKVHIHEIKPNREQPRKFFDTEKLDALTESVKIHGIIQPILVRPIKNGYEIVAGERRWKAAKEAGLKEIPCIIKEIDEKQGMELALIENLQREDLNPIEEALAYKVLMETYHLKQEEISLSVGKSRPYIANTIRLLNLTEEVRNMVRDNRLTSGHARVLLRIEDKKLQKEIAEKIVANQLSVRETESLVGSIIEKKAKKNSVKEERDSNLVFLEDNLKRLLGTKVNIVTGKKKGKIEIEYYSEEELNRLIEWLQRK
ncbi:ParB/RepB/Spo0J family partition protein [Clostridiaceae bacterium 35-E11]